MDRVTGHLERWKKLFKRVGCKASPEAQFRNLVNNYSERQRAYHNLNHIAHCLAELDQVAQELESPDVVEIAIWYHDAIYHTRSNRNEEESAVLAQRDLEAMGLLEGAIKTVSDLILSTKHNEEPVTSDTRYLIDIDLSILGAAPDIFQEYNRNIRKEYKWVPNFLFRKNRHNVLRGFLERKHIFYTDRFRQKYEHQARSNINSVIG